MNADEPTLATERVTPEQQRRNRIAMWRREILDPTRDEDLTPLAPLLDSYAADLIAEATDECRQKNRRLRRRLRTLEAGADCLERQIGGNA